MWRNSKDYFLVVVMSSYCCLSIFLNSLLLHSTARFIVVQECIYSSLCAIAFEEAKRNAPAIIFIDELDAIAPKSDKVYIFNCAC